MRTRLWGTRGSIPTPGPETVIFGGNTACVEVVLDNGEILVLDAGTGAPLADRRGGLQSDNDSPRLHEMNG